MAGCPVAPRCIKLPADLRGRRAGCFSMPWLAVEAAGSTLGRGSLNEGEAAGQTQRHPSSCHHCHLRDYLPPAATTLRSPNTPAPSCCGSVCVFFLEHSSPRYLLGLLPHFIQVCTQMSPCLCPSPFVPLPAWVSRQYFSLLGILYIELSVSPTRVSGQGLRLGPTCPQHQGQHPARRGAGQAEHQRGVSPAQSPLGTGTGRS